MKEQMSLRDVIVSRGRAAFPLVYIPEEDEVQIRRAIRSAATDMSRKMRTWTVTQGIVEIEGDKLTPIGKNTDKPRAAMDHITKEVSTQQKKRQKDTFIYVMHDFRKWMEDPFVIRQIRDIVPMLKSTPAMIVFAGPGVKKPPELEREIYTTHLPMPNKDDAMEILRDAITSKVFNGLSQEKRLALVEAGKGLSFHEMECAYALAASSGDLDPKTIWGLKAKVIDSPELQFIEKGNTLNMIGGLVNAKNWLIERASAYTAKAIEYGIEAPLGCVFLGPPGTGKSAMAKAIGDVFNAPILRLNMGACMRPHVGESERIVRELMGRIDIIGKVIVWLDEFEKMFAAASTSGHSDSGLFLRMFGEFLTWMGERNQTGSQCFLAATCNAIKNLQSALTRAGRFDVTFYYDDIAGNSQGYSGAEIEQAIKSAMFTAFRDGVRKTETRDIIEQIKKLKPSSELYSEELAEMEVWRDRTVPASDEDRIDVDNQERATVVAGMN